MRTLSRFSAATAVSLLSVLGVSLASMPAQASGTEHATKATGRAASNAAARGFHFSEGPVFNTATGSNSSRYRINNRLKNAIDHEARHTTIRIMSWNIMSQAATDHLLRAQARGVEVRVLMDASNWSREVPNPQFRRLVNGLKAGNHRKGHYGFSVAKVCHGSCRGKAGLAHSKYYLFDKTGTSRRVIMEGSANFTLAAAQNQWNDLYTFVNRKPMYDFAVGVFKQMWKDKRAKPQWVEQQDGNFTMAFSPITNGQDPEAQLLNQVKCLNATHGNSHHRTVIRVFPDVMRGERGLYDAKRLKALWNAGCDVKVGYTVLSYKAYRVLTSGSGRGRVPLRHMAVDNNHDGQFDKYFHLKVMTVNGVIGANKGAYRLIQGSSNLSGLSSASDENYGMTTNKGPTLTYQAHLEYYFNHASRALGNGGGDGGGRTTGVMALRTPDGQRAAFPDGYIRPGTMVIDPKTGQAVDPYAHVDMD